MNYNLTASGSILYITPTEDLAKNTQYTVTISAGVSGVFYDGSAGTLTSDYTFWFTSEYCPIFTTVGRVQLQAGTATDRIPEDTIYRLIHKNSQDVIDIYNTYHDTNYSYTAFGCTWNTAPPIFRRYVECKTAYDILAILELAATSNGQGTGGQLKTLGDMTIKYSGSSSTSSFDPSRKKQLYDCWMDAMHALTVTGNAGIKPAVRGWYDTSKQYPHPSYDPDHNRIVRTVETVRAAPCGPWKTSGGWRPRV